MKKEQPDWKPRLRLKEVADAVAVADKVVAQAADLVPVVVDPELVVVPALANVVVHLEVPVVAAVDRVAEGDNSKIANVQTWQ